MKKLIKNLILFLIIANMQNAFCYSLSYEELKNEISNKINKQIAQQLKEYSDDFEINIFGIPKNTILTNEAIKPKIETISQNPNFSPNSYNRILIKDSKGSLIKAFPITVQTKVFAPVLVASEIIPFNQTINQTNTTIKRTEISKHLGKTYKTQTNGLISKKNYQKGNVILADYTKTKSSILKNSNIDVIFVSKSLSIKLRAKALQEGAIGDTILVKSEKYNKTYNAVVKSENEAIVRI